MRLLRTSSSCFPSLVSALSALTWLLVICSVLATAEPQSRSDSDRQSGCRRACWEDRDNKLSDFIRYEDRHDRSVRIQINDELIKKPYIAPLTRDTMLVADLVNEHGKLIFSPVQPTTSTGPVFSKTRPVTSASFRRRRTLLSRQQSTSLYLHRRYTSIRRFSARLDSAAVIVMVMITKMMTTKVQLVKDTLL